MTAKKQITLFDVVKCSELELQVSCQSSQLQKFSHTLKRHLCEVCISNVIELFMGFLLWYLRNRSSMSNSFSELHFHKSQRVSLFQCGGLGSTQWVLSGGLFLSTMHLNQTRWWPWPGLWSASLKVWFAAMVVPIAGDHILFHWCNPPIYRHYWPLGAFSLEMLLPIVWHCAMLMAGYNARRSDHGQISIRRGAWPWAVLE